MFLLYLPHAIDGKALNVVGFNVMRVAENNKILVVPAFLVGHRRVVAFSTPCRCTYVCDLGDEVEVRIYYPMVAPWESALVSGVCD